MNVKNASQVRPIPGRQRSGKNPHLSLCGPALNNYITSGMRLQVKGGKTYAPDATYLPRRSPSLTPWDKTARDRIYLLLSSAQ